MTNFILRNPDVVFIHIPKTGGTSVRKALNGGIVQRYFGHIPDRYDGLFRFTIIRDPRERFLSAFRMFKYGNMLEGDYYAQPRWPDLTITTALDVIEDPWIGYDRSQRCLPWNLKHHMLPQTHPFHCLSAANFVLRFEDLESDFARLCAQLETSAELPKLRESLRHESSEEVWTAADEDRFQEIFRNDYQELGYAPEGAQKVDQPLGNSFAEPSTSEPSVFGLWPTYFSDRKVFLDAPQEALPSEDCALEPFVDEIIPGKPSESWAGRSSEFMEHFRQLQPEFCGASRLSHLLACTIVVLRRDPECKNAVTLFWRILDEQFAAIQSELSLRWLVSVSDTIADYGRTDTERAVGLNASILANTTKLHESELTVYYPERPWPPKKRVASGGALFDGMRTFWTEKGDMIENMFERSGHVADLSPTAGKVLTEVIERLRRGPTVYRRFARIFGKPQVPLLEEDTKKRMHRMMRRKL
ncbi:sulfotransferase family 2 domain-containing protein [uncultured Roseobacter sp.]|uniref:sulfotransferase family 2 domain-containing protein n=1 Tax=uncultured Roseobacter sp. TaxID=114847 RepID=UPI002618C2D8|nr:sulfotransferase family 2 domain-containing protein [uncultured Roseobacter sp.]